MVRTVMAWKPAAPAKSGRSARSLGGSERFRQYCSSSVAFIEDQVGKNDGYDRMFEAIGLAVLSGLGRRYTHPGRWIHLPFRGH
jgi:hypothetical protein